MIALVSSVLDMLAKEILSLQHPIVKHLVQLRSNKAYRDEHCSLLVTGINALKELSPTHHFLRVLVKKGCSVPFSYQSEETLVVSEEILKKITGLEQPEEVIAEIRQPLDTDISQCTRILLLDKVSDPGNLGTLLRTALAFGWGVFHLEGGVDLFNDKVVRSSKGAIFRLPFSRGNEKALAALIAKKPWILLAADPTGDNVQERPPCQNPLILAIGNESQGLSPYISQKFQRVCLPMSGKMESLNAAVAGAIFMFLLKDYHVRS